MKKPARATIDRLMQAVAADDALAFETLHEILLPILSAFTNRYVNTRATVDDIVQETFCRLWQSRTRFKGESAASTYIFGIAFNVIREFRTTRRSFSALAPNSACVTETAISANLEQAELHGVIENAMEELPPEYAKAIEMVYERHMRPIQCAEDLGCTEKAFRRRLEKARKRLSSILQPKLRTWWN